MCCVKRIHIERCKWHTASISNESDLFFKKLTVITSSTFSNYIKEYIKYE